MRDAKIRNRMVENTKRLRRYDDFAYSRDTPRFDIGASSSKGSAGTLMQIRNGDTIPDTPALNGLPYEVGTPVVYLTGNSKQKLQILGQISWYTGIDVTS